MRALSLAAALTAALVPAGASADRRELYTVIGLEPALLHTNDAYETRSSATTLAGAVAVTSYYGLTNTLHVGAALRTTVTRNITIQPVAVPRPDGSRPSGTLYEDLFAVSLGGVALYRFDTGLRAAPTLSLEGGIAHYSYANRAHAPSGSGFARPVETANYLAPFTRASVGLEYRLTDRLVAGVAVAVELAPSAHQPWAAAIPLNMGLIW